MIFFQTGRPCQSSYRHGVLFCLVTAWEKTCLVTAWACLLALSRNRPALVHKFKNSLCLTEVRDAFHRRCKGSHSATFPQYRKKGNLKIPKNSEKWRLCASAVAFRASFFVYCDAESKLFINFARQNTLIRTKITLNRQLL